LSGIYLNQRGREAQGIVDASEAATLQNRLVGALTGLIDEENRHVAIRTVMTRAQLFSGAFAHESPDLLVNYNGGYRVSWATSLGGIPQHTFEDNTKKWSGDHLVDPALVPGVLFMNQPFHGERASLLDLAPTILAALGLPQDEAMEGENLLL
jgi:predicted AlkP superfamily phosphohydrolase/phosphomutase